jgi:hypothetical protein
MQRFNFDTTGRLEAKARNLRFLLPHEASEGQAMLNAYYFKGTLPDGVSASWRTYLDDSLKDEGTRLSGDFFLPSPRLVLVPGSRFTLEIDTDEDMAPPVLCCSVMSRPFFYEPSLLTIPVPPEFAGNTETAQAFRQQMAMMQRPQTMDALDTNRVSLLDDSTTRGEERKLAAKCGPPMQGPLDLFLPPSASPSSFLSLVQ